MNKKLDDLISHIKDNFRFGSKIKQNIVDQWFKEYTLKVEERFTVYDELDALQIEHQKEKLLYSQLIEEKEKWFTALTKKMIKGEMKEDIS